MRAWRERKRREGLKTPTWSIRTHSCCSASVEYLATKGLQFYFYLAILIARLHFVPLSRSRFVTICAFHRPLSRADSAPSVRRKPGRYYLIDGDANCRNRCLFIRIFTANCELSARWYVQMCILECLQIWRQFLLAESIAWAKYAIFVVHFDPFHKPRGKYLRVLHQKLMFFSSFCLSCTSSLSLVSIFSIFSHLRKTVAI